MMETMKNMMKTITWCRYPKCERAAEPGRDLCPRHIAVEEQNAGTNIVSIEKGGKMSQRKLWDVSILPTYDK